MEREDQPDLAANQCPGLTRRIIEGLLGIGSAEAHMKRSDATSEKTGSLM
jgi:hypothetical protein